MERIKAMTQIVQSEQRPTQEAQQLDSQVARRAVEKQQRVILVIVGVGSRSRVALCWADYFAHAMGMRVRLVHAALEKPVEPGGSQTDSAQSAHQASWLAALHEDFHGWATFEAGVKLSLNDIRIAFAEPLDLILSEAAQPEVEMVVLDGLSALATEDGRNLPRQLLRQCPRPLLIIGPPGPRPVVIAATDCSDPALPVLREAWRVAAALGDQIFLVHNIDSEASQFAARIGMPMTPALADIVVHRSREWLESAAAIPNIVITRASDNATGVLGAAQSMGADLLVVGVKPDAKAPHRTAEQILANAQRSVLFVPFAGARTAATAG